MTGTVVRMVVARTTTRRPLDRLAVTVSPFNAIPPVVAALALVMAAVEVVLTLADLAGVGMGLRSALIEDYAVWGAILDAMWARGIAPPEHVMRLLTYPFVNFSFLGAAFGTAMLLALGKVVGEVFAPWATLTVFSGSAVLGALVWAALTGDPGPLAGAFPGVYGLIGAYTFLMWTRLAALGSRRIEAFRLIAVLLAIQLLFGLLLGGRSDWIADAAGFAAGFALSVVVSPGGFAALRDRLRRR